MDPCERKFSKNGGLIFSEFSNTGRTENRGKFFSRINSIEILTLNEGVVEMYCSHEARSLLILNFE